MNYTNNLREARLNRGMSVSELARRSGVSRVTINNIEQGYTNPTVSTVAAICKALNINPNEIFFNNLVNHEGQKRHFKVKEDRLT